MECAFFQAQEPGGRDFWNQGVPIIIIRPLLIVGMANGIHFDGVDDKAYYLSEDGIDLNRVNPDGTGQELVLS